MNFLTLKHILNLKYVLNSRHTRMILKTVGNWEILKRQIFGWKSSRQRGKASEIMANTTCAKFCRPCWSQTTPSRHSWRRPHLPPSTSSLPCLTSWRPWNQNFPRSNHTWLPSASWRTLTTASLILRCVLNVTTCARISHCYIYTYKLIQTPALFCISQFW